MPKREQFIIGEIYHVYNKGVNPPIFLDEKDYAKFKRQLSDFSYLGKTPKFDPIQSVAAKPLIDALQKKVITFHQEHNALIDIEVIASCLLPDHFHLLLRPITTNSLPAFMKKLCIGYANYFNKKYKRSGPLFQGRYRAALWEQNTDTCAEECFKGVTL